ncbi:DUF7059 domain-containing protein [Nesterenkonia sp. PF2B19]|uniref:DUF7059 domain-containing protein n=1 Tax=Nesterenkonia sp. PF2B19 TaxID=1881858 RepID=UPI000A7CA248|nr:methyltransferase [Nesterenkonia sp. PF2B19]
MTRLSREAAAALPAPRSESDAAVAAVAVLRAELQAARFTNARVSELLGPEAVAALDREQIAPGQLVVSRLLQQERPDPCAVFTALWLLDMEVDADVVSAALPRLGAEGLETLGLAHRDGGTCRPSVDLRPYQVQGREGESDLWVTSDLSAHQVDGPLPAEHVLGVGQASLTLASITHRRPVRRALDIGTGCGIQLFHLLDHAEHVVATDLSDRALAFTRFNLLLNAPALRLDPRRLADRVELRRGSLLDPVAGETFDLVVSNPPFVITPRVTEARVGERYTYRDGGRTGDELMAELIGGLPAVLAPGGTAQMLGNWEVHGASDWQERPRGWAQEAGLDAWFVQRDLQDGPGYAETWLRDAAEERDLDDYRRRYAEYVEDFATRGVTAVGFGLIWLHRPRAGAGRPGCGWRRSPTPWISRSARSWGVPLSGRSRRPPTPQRCWISGLSSPGTSPRSGISGSAPRTRRSSWRVRAAVCDGRVPCPRGPRACWARRMGTSRPGSSSPRSGRCWTTGRSTSSS